MKKCKPVTITAPAGADPDRVFWEHVRASVGEGCCPWCGCSLEPVDTNLGVGGMCRHCDHAWAMTAARASQWRMHDPHTGQPLPFH